MQLEFSDLSTILSAVLSIVLVSLAIHFGAKPFVARENETFGHALVVAIGGSVAATLVLMGLSSRLSGVLAALVAVAAWALVAALVYRVSWLRGLLIGLLAGFIWFGVSLLLAFLIGRP